MNDCNARDRTKNWWEDVPHNFWFIDAVGYRRTNHTSGTATHSGAHGVHSSHNGGLQAPGEGGNTGNGGMSHWSSSSIIQFGIMKWSGHNSTSTDFKNTISTPGTIFRFRADPAQTPYLVVKRKGYKQVKNYEITPEDFNIPLGSIEDIKVENVEQSKQVIMHILEGENSTARNIAILNAGAAIYISGLAPDLHLGIQKAISVIDEGHAMAKLNELVKESN
mgnify:CR=1 FL=1